MVTSAPAQQSNGTTPEFIRLPTRGPDPVFGLSRSTYYALEASGKIQMKRLRTPGAIRGTVLISVADMRALIQSASTVPNPRISK